MEALDEANTEAYPSDPVLVAPCCEQPTLLTEEIAIAAVEEARCNVIDEYGLRQPVEELPLDDWEPSQAVPVVNALIDGAPFEWGWDASSVVALDGVVDEDLRADLLSLLAGPDYAADAEEALTHRFGRTVSSRTRCRIAPWAQVSGSILRASKNSVPDRRMAQARHQS